MDSAPDEEDFRRTGKQTCQQIFRPLADHGFTLSNVLATQLALKTVGESIDWHQVLREGNFNSSGREFRSLLRGGIDKGFIRYVFDVMPKTWPSFLPEQEQVMKAHADSAG